MYDSLLLPLLCQIWSLFFHTRGQSAPLQAVRLTISTHHSKILNIDALPSNIMKSFLCLSMTQALSSSLTPGKTWSASFSHYAPLVYPWICSVKIKCHCFIIQKETYKPVNHLSNPSLPFLADFSDGNRTVHQCSALLPDCGSLPDHSRCFLMSYFQILVVSTSFHRP